MRVTRGEGPSVGVPLGGTGQDSSTQQGSWGPHSSTGGQVAGSGTKDTDVGPAQVKPSEGKEVGEGRNAEQPDLHR